MAVYVYGIKDVSYGTAATTNSMPTSMTTLPNTVKGSVTIEETEGSTTEFFVDQQFAPVKSVKTEEGKLTATMQFYDMTYANIAALKGGSSTASAYIPATGYVTVEKAIKMTLDSGHTLDMYNASLVTRIIGGGGRDKMFALEVKATPQLTADNAGTWTLKLT